MQVAKVKTIKHPPATFWFPMLLVLLALLLATGTVRAHGGTGYYQIAGMEMGDYTIHVWTSPGLLRTGEIHVDTAVFDGTGSPALDTLIMVTFTAYDGHMPPATTMASMPYDYYPHTREARFEIDAPGMYAMEVMVADRSGMVGTAQVDVRVQTITGTVKTVIAVLGVLTLTVGIWLLLQMRSFWHTRTDSPPHPSKPKVSALVQHTSHDVSISPHSHRQAVYAAQRGAPYQNRPVYGKQLADTNVEKETGPMFIQKAQGIYNWLNGTRHARALWIFMLIVVAHWMEHVLQIYQIYALGWAPSAAGGIIGVFFPVLITSETLHFVYDFIQWAGIVLLRGGFHGRARSYWRVAMIAQTWHFIEHVLLMGQYLTGYYIFGRIKQTSLLELFFPREELHFVYNLIVFVPMVIAVHYYLRPRLTIDREAATKAEAAAAHQA